MVTEFSKIVELVQQYISGLNFKSLTSSENKEVVLSHIEKYLENNSLCDGYDKDDLVKNLYSEMAEYSFLSKYLNMSCVEEINVNAWNDVKITYDNKPKEFIKNGFWSPQHAENIIKRLLQKSDVIWDNSSCIAVGQINNNIRITAINSGIVGEDTKLSVSIRLINPKNLGKDDFILSGTANEKMLNFLSLAFKYGLSIDFAGKGGTGKTTLMSWIARNGIPDEKRSIIISDIMEFDLRKYDEKGNCLNNSIALRTRKSNEDAYNYTQIKLLEAAMTMNPDYIIVAESKGEECMQAVMAANTGVAVMTTTHANSCADILSRKLVLCKLTSNMDDRTLKYIIEKAFPICIYCKELPDKNGNIRRRIMEIGERCFDETGNSTLKTLFRYDNSNEVFITENKPSEKTIKIMRENGLTEYEEKSF